MNCGLKWFRIDVDFEDNFELVCAEFGSTAFEVIVRLWQKIYKAGYYIEWNTEVALLFAKRHGLGNNVVSEIINCCIRRGLFNIDLYNQYGILTSKGIQNWFIDSTERRTEVTLIKQYLLVSVTKKQTNVIIIDKNVNINDKNVNRKPHITLHNSTVHNNTKESIGDKPPRKTFIAPTLKEVADYCKERNNIVDPQKFIDYFTASNWVDSRGNSVKNWKQKIITWENHQGGSAHGTANVNSGDSSTKDRADGYRVKQKEY